MHAPLHLLPAPICIALASMTALVPLRAQADPPRSPAMKCIGGGLRSHQFAQRPPHSAEYNFTGLCESRDGRFYSYSIDGIWTPGETNPANANASEVFHIVAASGAEQKFDGVIGARCASDPWLNKAVCVRVGDNVPAELRTLWPDLVDPVFPYTRAGIHTGERPALLAEYDRANGIIDRAQLLTRRVPDPRAGTRHDNKVIDANGIQRPGREVELNPQPLPPKEAQAIPATTPAAGNGAEAAIIIVSGTPPQQPVESKPRPMTINAETLKRAAKVPTSP